MGCFGDMTPTKQTDSTSSGVQTLKLPDWVSQGGQTNYDMAKQIQGAGFQPYTGQQVAPLSSNEIAAGNLVSKTAATNDPNLGYENDALKTAGSAPAQKYNFNTVTDQGGPLGATSNYINPYLAATLDPSLRAIALQGAKQRQSINSSAVMSGAFGDARHGVAESEQRKNEDLQVGDTTNKAYSDAYNQAMGLREQDAGRAATTEQNQNAANETALNRARQSSIDLTNLDKYGVSRALGLSSALGTSGANERSVNQATDTAAQQEFMRKIGFGDSQIQFLTQLLAGTPTDKTTTNNTTGQQTVSQPDNSGWQAIGSLAGSLFSAI